ncbi:hypothetical protein MAC_00194 [Metarhizium acridum CQMa 102]|uniref:Uncharacterized protein n=1 Tax=Metarhizium acridum (strain CQMa 102) TaxID=655827 RepID=E9DR25_METAQ|nr:uncharacterized protein MAC_00194 [Metarhizium acridum CQMa 102]EFY93703.1 hypothetical protein MAC_00194 [Metarhizium acridum CQMa 102]
MTICGRCCGGLRFPQWKPKKPERSSWRPGPAKSPVQKPARVSILALEHSSTSGGASLESATVVHYCTEYGGEERLASANEFVGFRAPRTLGLSSSWPSWPWRWVFAGIDVGVGQLLKQPALSPKRYLGMDTGNGPFKWRVAPGTRGLVCFCPEGRSRQARAKRCDDGLPLDLSYLAAADPMWIA